MKITVDGQTYLVSNWAEFEKKLLTSLGDQVVSAVEDETKRMKLIGEKNANFVNRWDFKVNNGSVSIFNPTKYAVYLEYGTFDYFNQYGLNSFPTPGYPSIPKKKELKAKDRKGMKKGMQPFAPLRRVLYNQVKMDKVIKQAVKNAQ